ncbi:hypothetical protein C5O77_10075 [Limosilactobacillus reuteri]|uniref:Uncharacterized protein n=1 Tax=Limosilactobacillus reuteri TaxID=1598 RepID=A0A3M6SAG3_LIMRT|nr:hypothetical protein [Limosilactobacillus reuteri]RMX24395.1 hypothetical protein C5O77_10075 [Limosilactobacillus reuteri]
MLYLVHPLRKEVTTITTHYSYEEALEDVARITNYIPPEARKAMQLASQANQQITEALAPIQEQLSQLQELISLTSNFDIKIASTLNRINNEITYHPVESFVKLADTVDDLSEPNFDHSNHESRKFTRNSYSGCNNAEADSTRYNVKLFIKKQIDQFKKDNSIEEIKVPDVDYCFKFFKLLFHTINTLCIIYGVYNDTFAYVLIEAIITNIDDILDFRDK